MFSINTEEADEAIFGAKYKMLAVDSAEVECKFTFVNRLREGGFLVRLEARGDEPDIFVIWKWNDDGHKVRARNFAHMEEIMDRAEADIVSKLKSDEEGDF